MNTKGLIEFSWLALIYIVSYIWLEKGNTVDNSIGEDDQELHV